MQFLSILYWLVLPVFFSWQSSPDAPTGILANEEYVGAWMSESVDKGRPVTQILIVSDTYFTIASFLTKDHHFLSTSGGTYKMEDGKMSVTIEYHSPDHYQVGKQHVLHAKPTETGYKLVARDGMVLGDWKRIDSGSKSEMAGLWYAAAYRNEAGDTIRTDYKVKTIKILSDTRFQWVAFDTISRKFVATAGGTYSVTQTGYVESLEFYANADDRIGKSLGFRYKLEGSNWTHTGKSSQGLPLYELWSKK
ncbi:putative Membrane or secreted protein [Imperialibacter sp. EC-SDR9]|nr:putative Membrane or secreted protein [Imperialibacter sp. 75]CAD5296896.1 putative Membrane or secreted protein [Imperialibacter sp. 89]VVT24027.1 putative Membrane or secreted protein [Imperialibacter sp. EC-SDR9]